VIPTRNGEDTIEACISSILDNELVNEIILVDDSSDRTREIVSKYPAKLISAYGKNISEKSNLAITSTNCDIIAFTDQDCKVPNNWIKHAQNVMSKTGADVLGGSNITFPDASLREKCSGLILGSWFGGGPTADRYNMDSKTSVSETDKKELLSCNLFFLKTALEKVGGFEARLNSCEEIELLFRMSKKGFTIFYDSSLYVWHRRAPIFKPFLKKIFWYANGRGKFLRMTPKSFKPYLLIPSIFMLYMIFGTILSLLGIFVESFVVVLSLYFIIDTLASVKTVIKNSLEIKAILYLMTAFPLMHFTYGIGLLSGYLGKVYHYDY
jgi:glycosyltransferase involved in cell wall biosynthesis